MDAQIAIDRVKVRVILLLLLDLLCVFHIVYVMDFSDGARVVDEMKRARRVVRKYKKKETRIGSTLLRS